MNKIKIALLALTLVMGHKAFSQDIEGLSSDALQDAQVTATATIEKDYKTVLKYTHPVVVSMMGGEAAGVRLLKSTFESMEKDDFFFEKSEMLEVLDLVYEQGEYRCVIVGLNQMRMKDTRIYARNHLFGVYSEEAGHWYFVEAKHLKDLERREQIFPGMQTALVIPEISVETEAITD